MSAPLVSVHDADPIAWVVVAAYAATALITLTAARRARGGEARLWWLIALVIVALGVNKQLDLQSDLTAYLRGLARSEGWYRERRGVQRAFIAALAVASVVGVGALLAATRRVRAAVRIALVGLAILAAFVVLRAASFHHVDIALRTPVFGAKLYAVIELVGIAAVAAGGALALRRRRPSNARYRG